MKILISLLVFSMTLTLTLQSVAGDSAHAEGHENAAHEGGHGGLANEMNKLFPKKIADPSAREVPAKPELLSPEFNAKLEPANVELKWKEVAGATHYHVQIATDPNFKWLVKNEDAVKATSLKAEGLEAGKSYFWRVLSVNSANVQLFTKSQFSPSAFQTK